jgi:hypothetical protein
MPQNKVPGWYFSPDRGCQRKPFAGRNKAILRICSEAKRGVPQVRTSVPGVSCYAPPDRTACAVFCKENRMKYDNATNLDRKSGVPGTMMDGFQCFPSRAQPNWLPRRHATNNRGGFAPSLHSPTVFVS